MNLPLAASINMYFNLSINSHLQRKELLVVDGKAQLWRKCGSCSFSPSFQKEFYM